MTRAVSLRFLAKRGLAAALTAPARLATAGRVRILMYHRFGTSGTHRRMNVDLFERQLRYLRRHFVPCSLADVVSALHAGGPLPQRAVVVTVDDGYGDFHEYAYPLLRRHAVPATLFVVSKFVDGEMWLWFDAVHFLVHAAPEGVYDVSVAGETRTTVFASDADRQQLWAAFADACMELSETERREQIERLARELRVRLPQLPTPEYAAMTWRQVAALDPALVDVGAHTCTHPVLSRCQSDAQWQEIVESRRVISSRIDREVRHFCYPYGRPQDYTAETARLVREAGFRGAVVAHGGLVTQSADPFLLERIGADDDMQSFAIGIDGVEDLRQRASSMLRRVAG